MIEELFHSVTEEAIRYRKKLADIAVGTMINHDEMALNINSILSEDGESSLAAIDALRTGVEKSLVNSSSPRYFGFVVGGSLPVSVAADWLTSVWNQNAQVYNTSPAASMIEEVVASWLLEMLDIPRNAGVGFVTGTQMAHFTALSIARNAVLQEFGWNVEQDGLQSAPHIQVICGEGCHATIHSAVHLIGLGTGNIRVVQSDYEGRMRLDSLKETLNSCTGPIIVCLQAGNVNTGSFDPISDIIHETKKRNAWVHIDGAFGLWAAVSPRFKYLVAGIEQADSWATDAHKWLNVPYDSGMVFIRSSQAHRGLKTARCAYAGTYDVHTRDGSDWVPENSRRARAFVLYATLRKLGKKGVRDIIENCCDMANLFSNELIRLSGVRVLNNVVLNQVLWRVEPEGIKDIDNFNSRLATRIQERGVCWMGTTKWHEQTVLRISVSNWATGPDDVMKSVEDIAKAIIELNTEIPHEKY